MARSTARTHLALAALAAAGSLAATAPAAADEVHLKGGGRLSGVIVERTPETLVIETAPGRVGIPLGRVERVVSGPSALGEYHRRAARLAADDLAGWLELAHWARAQGLATPAREAAEHAAALDPRDEAAQRLLGNVRFEGRWMSPDDARRAQGLVLFEGDWITPAERAERLRAQAEAALAEKARAEADARAREAEARARAAEADARRAESEAREAEQSSGGIPLWWGGSGVVVPSGHSGGPHGCAGSDCRVGRDHEGRGREGARPPARVARPGKPQALVGPGGGRAAPPRGDDRDGGSPRQR